jgi:cyclohexa-1,5-dienecarbonyl-CoA hydratase
MTNELAILELDNDIIRLKLQRPPLNFLNMEMMRKIEAHFEEVGNASGRRALVIESGGAAFCAGLDVQEQTKEGIFLLVEQFHKVATMICSFAVPTVALVRGMALGAGNELAACCDFVFASESASFGQPEIKMGALPTLAPLLLPPLIGQRRAGEMILTGRLLGAREAHAAGLIHRVLPDDQLQNALGELLRSLRELSLPVLELAVDTLRKARLSEMETRLRESEALYFNHLMELDDRMEGVRAFLERRPPKWSNH